MTEHNRAFVPTRHKSEHWPPKYEDDREQVTLVVTSKPDTLGRQSFWIKWYDGSWRAQHFFSHVATYEEQWKNVVVVEELEER